MKTKYPKPFGTNCLTHVEEHVENFWVCCYNLVAIAQHKVERLDHFYQIIRFKATVQTLTDKEIDSECLEGVVQKAQTSPHVVSYTEDRTHRHDLERVFKKV